MFFPTSRPSWIIYNKDYRHDYWYIRIKYAEFGQHELVSDFSEEAINAILSQYNRVKSESNDPASIAWEPLFNDALEWCASGVVYELNSEVREHTSEIINMVRTADISISTDAKEKFDNLEHDLNDEELLQFLKPELMKSPDYLVVF